MGISPFDIDYSQHESRHDKAFKQGYDDQFSIDNSITHQAKHVQIQYSGLKGFAGASDNFLEGVDLGEFGGVVQGADLGLRFNFLRNEIGSTTLHQICGETQFGDGTGGFSFAVGSSEVAPPDALANFIERW